MTPSLQAQYRQLQLAHAAQQIALAQARAQAGGGAGAAAYNTNVNMNMNAWPAEMASMSVINDLATRRTLAQVQLQFAHVQWDARDLVACASC